MHAVAATKVSLLRYYFFHAFTDDGMQSERIAVCCVQEIVLSFGSIHDEPSTLVYTCTCQGVLYDIVLHTTCISGINV